MTKIDGFYANWGRNIRNNQYFALVHYPVYNRNREVVAASLTPIDVHDLARLARTYSIKRFFLVTPLEGQRVLVQRIVHYWTDGLGAGYNPRRREALSCVGLAETLDEVKQWIHERWGRAPLLVGTTARHLPKAVDYQQIQRQMEENSDQPYLLLFGTGWGLTDELLDSCPFVLKPIEPCGGNYNHLSIRSAAAIVLDRLCRQGSESAREEKGPYSGRL